MVQRFELPLRHPKKPVPKSRRPRNLRIPKRHHCFSRKRRLGYLSLRWFKRKHIRSSHHVRHITRVRGHRHASSAKVHKSRPPTDLTPPNKPPSSSPQPKSVSTLHPDRISTGVLPLPSLPLEGITFHPPLDAISSLSEQPQVYQSNTGNTLRSQDDTSDEGFCDGDSDYSPSDIACEGEWVNGRFYCPDGYHFPIDDQQHEVELLIHSIWTKHSPVGQKLFLAPVNTRKMHNVLDIGSGPCYWVEDFAVKYPHTTVTGIDLFPHEVMAQPNVKMRKDDVELPWPAQNKYELIHSRDMVLAIRDWDTLLSRAFQSLVPGGSIELQEIHYSPQSKDGSVHSTAQPLADFFSKIARGLKVLHVDLHAITLLAEKMRAAGFVNVTTNISYIPISRNAQSETENETENDAATWMKSAMYCGLHGTALGPLTRGLGWRSEEVEVYLVGVRNCLRGSLQDTKLPMYIIHAQRPLR